MLSFQTQRLIVLVLTLVAIFAVFLYYDLIESFSSSRKVRGISSHHSAVAYNKSHRKAWKFTEADILTSPDADCLSPFDDLFTQVKLGKCEDILLPKNMPKISQAVMENTIDFSNTVLIISMNKAHYESIAKSYRLYRGLFFKIIYCVTAIDKLAEFQQGRYAHLINKTFVEWARIPNDSTGETFYNCIPIVLDTFPDIRRLVYMRQLAGILHITDDFIMNIWRFRKSELDLRNNWLLGPPIHLYDIDRKTKCVGITGNNSQDCKEAEHWSFLDNYQNATKNALTETHLMFPDFLQNLTNVTKGERRIHNIWVDLFYMTSEYIPLASDIFRIFAKHKVYMELCVGTIVEAITDPHRLAWLPKSGQMYGEGRTLPIQKTYDADYFFYHPFKMAFVETAEVDKQCVYCHLVEKFDLMRTNLTNYT